VKLFRHDPTYLELTHVEDKPSLEIERILATIVYKKFKLIIPVVRLARLL
jgi:hypothetical protein